MKETVYLIVDRHKVVKMTKSLVSVNAGQVLVRLDVMVTDRAFAKPTLVRSITVDDWREGIDLADVEFRGNFITEEEAEAIRQRRLLKMKELLEQNGYTVQAAESEPEK